MIIFFFKNGPGVTTYGQHLLEKRFRDANLSLSLIGKEKESTYRFLKTKIPLSYLIPCAIISFQNII